VTPADPAGFADALERAFPDLTDIRPCRLLGSGFHNIAIETAGGVVFRLGNDDSGPKRYAQEFRVLPALSELLPAVIPVPRWFVRKSEDFPRSVIGYRKIEGQPFVVGGQYPDDLAEELAAFLVALHTIPVETARKIGLTNDRGKRGCVAAWSRIRPALRGRITEGEYRRLSAWWDDFNADDSLFEYEPAVIHTDVWQENILVDDAGHLAGVLDFDHVAIGDPAQDIAYLRHLGDDFPDVVRRHYGEARPDLDPQFDHRVDRHWEFRELAGVDWALENDDEEELRDAIRKLRWGAIFA
jgi:aminoglycoside 2''-phosphotransferase